MNTNELTKGSSIPDDILNIDPTQIDENDISKEEEPVVSEKKKKKVKKKVVPENEEEEIDYEKM